MSVWKFLAYGNMLRSKHGRETMQRSAYNVRTTQLKHEQKRIWLYRLQQEYARKMQDLETLRHIISQWNANRLDLFELSMPNEVSVTD